MRGTIRRPATPVMMVLVLLVTITVGVVVYQVIGREEAILGSAGGFDQPANAGTDDLVATWAGAAAVGDYATAQSYMEDDDLLYGIWQAKHSNFQQQIVGYQIVSRETVGQTTTAVVRFDLASNYATCIPLTINETTQRIRIDRGYAQCAAQP